MIILKYVIATAVFLMLAYIAGLSYSTRQHRIKPGNERQLANCPGKPNCVYSLSAQTSHSVKAFTLLEAGSTQSWNTMVSAVEQAGGEILVNDGEYLHAVFSSALFRFKDDFEARIGEDQIEVRSASRAGRTDMGKNRQRVETIRLLYAGVQ